MCDVHGCGALQAPTRRRLLGAGAALASWWLGAPLAAKEALPERGLSPQQALGVLQQAGSSAAKALEATAGTAQSIQQVTQRLYQPGGSLEQLEHSAQALTLTVQDVQTHTLPRVYRASDEATRAARTLGRLGNSVADNPG